MSIRLGVMGGTFDPIHHAHLANASEAAHCLGLDAVLFIPAGRPWQKRGVSAAEDRYAMTRLAVTGNPRFSASRLEIDRPGPTYTVETLRELRARHGARAKLYFIAGADVLASIGTWREAARLTALAHFVFCARAGYPLATTASLGERVSLLDVPVLGISSTLIRRRVRQGMPIRYLVPDRVADYVARTGLYRRAQR